MRNKQIFERSKEVGGGVAWEGRARRTYVITDDGEMLFGAYLNAIPAKDHSGRGRARAAAALLTHDTRQVQSFSHWTDGERDGGASAPNRDTFYFVSLHLCGTPRFIRRNSSTLRCTHHETERQVCAGRARGDN